MPRFDKKKPSRDVSVGGDYLNNAFPLKTQKIVEPRCHVCQHKNRDQIDRLLAMKTPYAEIARLFSSEERKLDDRSVSNHEKKHLQYENEAIRQIIEHEAGIAQENLETGVKGAFLRRVALDVSIKKVFDGILSGEIEIEAKDVVKMIELRERLDSNSASAQIEQYELQFNAFKTAIQEICGPDIQFSILNRTKELLQVGDRPALQASD